jgi:fatty-acyl-CoA synthase
MELDEVPVEVCVDVGVDGAVNLFALLEQTAQRFADRGAVYRGERRCCTWRELRDPALQRCGFDPAAVCGGRADRDHQ